MKKLIIGLAAVVAIFAGWYYASPLHALNNLRAAALEADAEGLEEQIDFASLRESVKAELKLKVLEQLSADADAEDDESAFLWSALADRFVENLTDTFVTPKGIVQLIKHRKKEGAKNENGDIGSQLDRLEVERDGISKFRLRDPENSNNLVLIFRRDGLGWKLAEVDMTSMKFPQKIR